MRQTRVAVQPWFAWGGCSTRLIRPSTRTSTIVELTLMVPSGSPRKNSGNPPAAAQPIRDHPGIHRPGRAVVVRARAEPGRPDRLGPDARPGQQVVLAEPLD